MMTKPELQKVCKKAAEVIERDGLCKGDYGTNDGPKCALGALRFARSGSTTSELPTSEDQLGDLFRAARPRTTRDNIVAFNDAARTRKRDVVRLLRDMASVG